MSKHPITVHGSVHGYDEGQLRLKRENDDGTWSYVVVRLVPGDTVELLMLRIEDAVACIKAGDQ